MQSYLLKPNAAKNPAAEGKKIRGWWKAKDTSTVEDRRLSACAILRDRDEKIFQRVRERAPVFQKSLEHNQRWKETAKILLQFLLPATKNPHLLQESTLPECLAQSSYWQTFLCLTYMCFLVFKTKNFKIKTSKYEGEILKSLLLWIKLTCYINLLQSNLYVISILLSVQANHKGAEGCLYFFLSSSHAKWSVNSHLPETDFI